MKMAIQAALVLALLPAAGVQAQEREVLGYGTMFNNDFLGDGEDRWRSGSYTISRVTGPGWSGGLPSDFGEIRELRMQAQIIAPANLSNPAPGDRRYAGVLSVGLHTHFARGPVAYSLGADMVVTGSQTGIASFQDWAHDWLDGTDPKPATDNQIGNAIYPTVLGAATLPYQVSALVEARPFVEAQAGAETLLRVGGDLVFGSFGQGDLMVRDSTTGHLYNTTHTGGPGVGFVVGGDVAFVSDSHYLPSSDGYELTDARTRLRAGMNWQGQRLGMYYGLTWLGEEFEAQREGQLLGSLNVRLEF
ncbi:lipid A-modifier LpxR family protein [Actibacterium sp. D379-3]